MKVQGPACWYSGGTWAEIFEVVSVPTNQLTEESGRVVELLIGLNRELQSVGL